MPAINETVATPKEITASLIEEVIRRHESNSVNINNNRGFALLEGNVVEIVRRGRTSTRIRRNLNSNTDTELVATASLEGYVHPVAAPLV